MLDFISYCKQTIIKYKKQLFTFALIPVFMFRSSLSSFAADSPYFLDGMYNFSFNGQKGNFKFYNPSGSMVLSGDAFIYTHEQLGVIAETPNTSNISNISRLQYGIVDGYTYPLIIPNLSDYKFFVMVYRGAITPSSFTFNPSSMSIYTNDATGVNEVMLENFDSVNYMTGFSGNPSTIGYIYYGDIPPSFDSSIINGFNLYSDVGGVFPIKANVQMFLYNNVNDDFEENFNVIVNAINDQTSEISSAINDAANQVTDKIDEVLTPEGENNLGEAVDQITDQVQENLGALGFAHDTVENFIGLFNEEPPAPVINVPPLKMKIKGVEYQFFNGYQYDFRSMEDNGLSVLVGAVRTAGSLVLWWAFLQYCLKEFDGFFRR